MKIALTFHSKNYQANLAEPLDISLPLRGGNQNPICYYADAPIFEAIVAGAFIGSVRLGGNVNHQKVTITPHGNGTHTECYGHISADESATIHQCHTSFHTVATLISCRPALQPDGDSIIRLKDVLAQAEKIISPALVIRSLPNNDDKRTKNYSGANPPYLDTELIRHLVNNGVEHLIIDLPSVDREVDGGTLAGHKAFWNVDAGLRKHCTITELAFIPNHIVDGLYLLNLQIPSFEMDAAPSKPVLYKLSEVPTFSAH
jgi:kynurenine formamidase